MAWAEKFGRSGKREGSVATERTRIWTGDSTSEADAESDLAAAAPTTLDGLVRTSIEVDEIENTGYYVGTVVYKSAALAQQQQPQAAGEETFSFDTTGGTAHITSSLETVKGYDVSGGEFTPVDGGPFGQLINVDGDGTVRGLDVPTPKFKFTVRTVVATGSMSVTYIRTIYELTGSTNDAAVAINVFGTDIEFDAEEVLFLGARGSKSTNGDWFVDFEFEAMPPFGPQTIGEIASVSAAGTQYKWAFMTQKVQDTGAVKILGTAPKIIMIERVYPLKDFTDLGVAGTPAP
jgi:hypothetical protein